ncbi:MAG: type II toxin-antitoxin system YoeB family toxin [Syntrophobacteraceae bacterium]
MWTVQTSYLKHRSTKAYVARRYKVSEPTMFNRLRKNKIETEPKYSGQLRESRLKHGLSGFRSRRISDEHRIVYKVESDSLLIAQLRHHY